MDKLLALLDNSPGAVFRAYMAVILIMFGILSFGSVNLAGSTATTSALPGLILSDSFWYGQLSIFGALSLLFRSKLASWKLGALLGDLASVCMFVFLSFEYLTSKPTIYAGGIMAATAVIFLIGGLVYERRSP